MARVATVREPGFIWLPRTEDVRSNIKINSVSVITDYISAKFSRALCPEIGDFSIDLINAGGEFAGVFSLGQSVELFVDLSDGTTKRFGGKIDTLRDKSDMGFAVLEVAGSHVSSELLDIMVTESYDGSLTVDEILKDLVDNYLTDYTYVNVGSFSVKPTLNWSNKPLWDCVEDLVNLADADCYVDDDKDFHFFVKKSVHNSAEAAVWNDTLISTEGLAEQTTVVKNKISVYGEDDVGLPVIRTSQDVDSQSNYGVKEKVVQDTAVTTGSQANELADAHLEINKTPDKEGRLYCFMLPSIAPGETLWVTEPVMKITEKMKVFSYTHSFPDERTTLIIQKKRDIPNIFRDRMKKELALEKLANPYKMTSSINLVFDDDSELSSYDSNLSISEGSIRLSSGGDGTATSLTNIQGSDVTECHLRVAGESLKDVEFRVSCDGGSTYQNVAVNAKTNISVPGKYVILQFKIKSLDVVIDSIALLIK